MLKISNIKLFIACADSDGFKGFYYSHDGYWTGGVWKGIKTIIECQNTCLQDCVAFATSATSSAGRCYHYRNRADIVSAKESSSSSYKAYIKCSGRNE